MKFLKVFWPAIEALQAGKSLANPAIWKSTQLIASLGVFVGALSSVASAFFGQELLTNDQVMVVASGIAALVNAYLTVATTKTIGVGDAPAPADDPATPAVIVRQPPRTPVPGDARADVARWEDPNNAP